MDLESLSGIQPGAAAGMPPGLGMRLAQEPELRAAFASLEEGTRRRLLSWVRDAQTGEEARVRARHAAGLLRRRAEERGAL